MALYHSDAFVLRTYKLGESDQIVVLFTRDYGKLRVVAHRNRRGHSRTASYYQPLTRLHVIAYGRPTRSLYHTHSVDIAQAFRVLHEDFNLLSCGLYMTELIDINTQDRQPAPELFALFDEALEALAGAGQVPKGAPASVLTTRQHERQRVTPPMVLRHFEISLLTLSGYALQLSECAHCGGELPPGACGYNARAGGLVCDTCAATRHTLKIGHAACGYLRGMMGHVPLPEMLPDTAAQQEMERLLHLHLTTCLGREIKSYPFLYL